MATTGTADTSSKHGTEPSQASGIGQTLRDATYQKVTDQKTRASDTLGSVASAVRSMTEPLAPMARVASRTTSIRRQEASIAGQMSSVSAT
jgi:hypothetical protein